MGETGCGKTRLVSFLCSIMVPRDKETKVPATTNMIIMKVHGGVTNEDIKSKVWDAERIADENRKKYGENVFTILFFDEANTTESIGLIKEIMCDNSMEGKPLSISKNLKFVAACNPYRKHPEDVITKLERAGLGYHVKAIKTKDRFGRIPMRRLVYRVQPLPQSLLSFVWDFGQLSTSVENLYIRHMVRRYMSNGEGSSAVKLPNDEQLLEVISSILTQSQEYMRNLKDECSFVSLRDVDRVLQVMCWFYSMSKVRRTLFELSDKKLKDKGLNQKLNDETRSLILALAVCYTSSLSNRKDYWKYITQFFRMPCRNYGGYEMILDEIDRVQEVFLDSVHLEENSNIARNNALKENIFMMVICIELRIPLFLVGKPGSSKSLAKVIVTDAMQGRAAKTPLFKELKQVQMVSFQCSPLSSPEGIISTFHQCASFQQNYKDNLDTFVSVVVLDEIGLAEDSERMPLKTLHPLLEDGCQGDEIAEHYKKVAFIGISNWSLDPAKMNRGVFVQRQVPDSLELENTARGICASSPHAKHMLIKPLTSGYLEVFEKASEKKREFFGLRDFYSLMKMVNQMIKASKDSPLPTYQKLRFAIRRNFSGLDNLDTFEVFERNLKILDQRVERQKGDPDDSFRGLLTSWMKNEYSDSRHLLLLTENYSAIAMFEQAFLAQESVQPIVIFGSSFRRDQEYTQICRNINKIKICMETGKLVILVNSDNLYESLYDAMNQYYVYFGGERYVDLGLGSHRVKCPVHKNFKLIVVAEKQSVYEKFPIPLINRLEKHCLMSKTLLSKHQNNLARSLKEWVQEVTRQSLMLRDAVTEDDVGKVFIGYYHDVCASISLETWTDEMNYESLDSWDKAQDLSRNILLWCAAPDAILRLSEDRDEMQNIYWKEQAHESFKDYLIFHFKKENKNKLYAQITTHSSLLTAEYKHTIKEATGIDYENILLLEALPSFDTEQQFVSKIKGHIVKSQNNKPVLIVVQCDFGDKNTNLIASAKYAIMGECTRLINNAPISIIFIVQLTPMENKTFHSIQCGIWHSAHIDNLYSPRIEMPSINDMQNNRMSVLISKSIESRNELSNAQEVATGNEEDKCLDLRLLIERNLQRAVSLVRDPEENLHRSTTRVSLILFVLHDKSNKDCVDFVRGVSVLVQKIMADRESDSSVSSPDKWLSKEASSVVAIEKFGTFRRACLEAYDTRISPILGGLFAALDTNNNLDLLKFEAGTWQRNLWITLINTTEICEQLFITVNTERGIRFEVNGTGYGGRLFRCKMPFSWILLSTFEAILLQHKMLLQEFNEQEKRFTKIFEGLEFIKVIDSIPSIFFYEILESYINDFVQTMYPEEKDRILISLSIKQMTLSQITPDNTPVSSALMFVHQLFQENSTRFNYFRDISNVWRDCTDAVMAHTGSFSDVGKTVELLGLAALIEHISPKSKSQISEWFISDCSRENWLELVYRYRQVVNQTLAFCQETMIESSAVQRIRFRWNRIIVMQLCIENLTSKENVTLPTKTFSRLWTYLNNLDVDMKCIGPLQKIEQFLESWFKGTKTKLIRTMKTCKDCGVILRTSMFERCDKCEVSLTEETFAEVKTKRTQAESDSLEEDEQKVVMDRIRDNRQRCNLVLMDIVSQLCFADNTAPKSEVIEWLLSYSFQSEVDESQQLLNESTKDLDTGVNSNNIFKAFIFKHLLRTDGQEFKKHLKNFVTSVQTDTSEPRQLDDVILSLIFSVEDHLLETISSNAIRQFEVIERYLDDAQTLFEKKDTSVDLIYCVAQTRVALTFSARYLDMAIKINEENEKQRMDGIDSVLQKAESLCKRRTLSWKFLLKHLSQEFGTDTLLAACKSPNPLLSWIKMDTNVTSTVDMYSACGEEYCTMKVLLLTSLTESEENKVLPYIQLNEEKQTLVVMFELALHREFALHNRLQGRVTTAEELKLVEETVKMSTGSCKMSSLLALDESIHNQYRLEVSEGAYTDRDISIKCLLFHWLCIINHFSCTPNSILKPLFKLALYPGELKDVFLPCMPQDDLADIRQQLLEEAETAFNNEKTVYYRCENGHSYEIGQCGRPWVRAKCLCGAKIGGQFHNLESGNELDDCSDRSQKGYCLGYPQDRQPGAVPERSLTALQNALLKCLLHMTMYLGCGNSLHDVSALVQHQTESIRTFIFDHILIDLEDLMRGMSLNRDEVLLLLHSFIDSILKKGIHIECIQYGKDLTEQTTLSGSDELLSKSNPNNEYNFEDAGINDDDVHVAVDDDEYDDENDDDDMNEELYTEFHYDNEENIEDINMDSGERNINDEFRSASDSENEGKIEDEDMDDYDLHTMLTSIRDDNANTPFHTAHNDDDSENEAWEQTDYDGLVDTASDEVSPWKSKQGRSDWEDEFARLFLSQFLEDRKTTLNLAKRHLESCNTSGILTALNDNESEKDVPDDKEGLNISDNPNVWIYRKPVSIEHFCQAFQQHLESCPSDERKFPVLSLFLVQINELQALRFIPSILKLNKMLIQRYSRKIYQSQASDITIKQVKEGDFSVDDSKLFQDMIEAWNTVRNALKNNDIRTDKGRTALPLEWANLRMTDETELAYILPAMEGKGMCSYALLDLLFRRQNELIQTYVSSLNGSRQQVFTVVEPRDISTAHLITFHPERDLLPIILENCTMSSTHIVNDEYDFKAIEKRVIDRFISTKSKVAFDGFFKIDLMVYRSHLTHASQLDTLNNKIPQEQLDSGIKLALCNHVQDVPSIGQVLSQLDIAISFLNITGGNQDESLYEYMIGKLQLGATKLTSKIQQHCLLKHVKSLWMTFTFHRSYIMVCQGKQVQVIFESIDSEYHETLREDIMMACQSFAERLLKERLTKFLELLFEFIMLELTKRENKDDEDYFDKSQYRLVDCLTVFGDLNGLDVDVHDIPPSILCIHSLHMWIAAAKVLESRVVNNYDSEV